MLRSGSELSHIGPRQLMARGPMQLSAAQVAGTVKDLNRIGIGLDARDLQRMFAAYQEGSVPMFGGFGMDADLTAALTIPSVSTPIQFLQEWLPGFVYIITQDRPIDRLVGITTQGRWEDEEIIQGLMEHVGNTKIYHDQTNVPLDSWNTNFERRTIVRSELGMIVGRLEERRATLQQVSSAQAKRLAASEALEITRNNIGFNGFNSGANRTYGLLNDPNLPAYVNVPNGAGGNPEWSTKTFLEITADIRTAMAALRNQSGDRITPGKDPITLAIATGSIDAGMTTTTDLGLSVRKWIDDAYPNTRIESVINFNAANGGANVAYLYGEGVDDMSTDDRRTFVQVVPAKFQTLGVEQRAKGYVEDYTNATAGILTKRPFAVYRFSGI